MVRPDFSRAANEAKSLLKRHGYADPPIDPEEIAENEGLRVVYANFAGPDADKISGFFRLANNSIVINKDIAPSRITFTIAHELGHYILHREYIESNNYIPMPRNNEYEGLKPKEEIEADTFAANLLVPLDTLKKYASYATEFELARFFCL